MTVLTTLRIAKDCRTTSFLLDDNVLIDVRPAQLALVRRSADTRVTSHRTKNRYPIYIAHTKPAEMEAIMQEIEQLNHAPVFIESSQQPDMQAAYS